MDDQNGGRFRMSEDIRDYFAQFSGKEVAFLPNPGNAGDSVIAAATYQCLEAAGLRHEVPHLPHFRPEGRIVFYGGGGNLVGDSTYSHNAISRIHRTAKHLTILPQTIRGVDALLDQFGSNVTIICREPVSYEYVKNRNGRYETLLMHDVALSLDIELLLRGHFAVPVALRNFLTRRILYRRGHATIKTFLRGMSPGPVARRLKARAAGGVLYAFRLDGEATNIEIPEGNIDLSTVFEFGVAPAQLASHAARSMMQALLKFDEVHTNRLHVGISAALLGKKTFLYSNNYYKVRAIYEFSMRHRFPHVTWMG